MSDATTKGGGGTGRLEDGIDLACERFGGRVLAANDDFFAPKENLVRDAEAVWDPHRYVESGKWMDGWETRRRRQPGHDWCLLRLGLAGLVRRVVVDTSHFTGNFPESCSLEAAAAGAEVGVEELLSEATAWCELLPRSPLAGDSKNRFEIASPYRWTHLRLRIYPDGGVARLRVFGEVVPTAAELAPGDDGPCNLASLACGARVVAASDSFYSSPQKVLLPDPPRGMFDGWETRRRRGPGNDWIVVRLAGEAELERAEVDTRYFRGNAPGSCSLEGACAGPDQALGPDAASLDWRSLLAEQPLEPDREHRFDGLATGRAVTHVRLQIYPDGGVARLRLFGRLTAAGRRAAALRELCCLPPPQAEERLLACCGSERWAREMASARPFADLDAARAEAERVWWSLDREDWLEAFAAHPRIGESRAARATGERAARWSAGEQAASRTGDADLQHRLAEGNRRYEATFGYLFIVCAAGRSAGEILAELEARLGHDAERELRVAAGEQLAITQLRLEKLLS